MQGPLEGSQRQTPIRAQRRQASPASAGNHPRFSRAQGVTRRDTDDSYVCQAQWMSFFVPAFMCAPVWGDRVV